MRKNMTLGEKIKLLRKEKNWSQQKLGEEIDIAKSVVWKYEKDEAIYLGHCLNLVSNRCFRHAVCGSGG